MIEENRTVYSYISLGLTSIITVLVTWFLTPHAGHSSVYLILILLVTFNAWLAGIQQGLLITFITTFNLIYFFIIPYQLGTTNSLITVYEIGIFLITGSSITYIIERYKKTDVVAEYKQKLADYRKDLEKIATDNNKMHKEIKLRDEFLSIASHELKTPLTSMLLKLQGVLHSIRNVTLANFSVEKLLKDVQTAEQQSQRLARLINDLLNVSLITTGRLNLELGKADLVALLQEVISEFTEKLEKGGYTVKLDTDEKIEAVIDKLRIEQMITNLLSNAIKYGRHKPIEISLKGNDMWAKLVVKDNGIGIQPGHKERIFELFERGVSNHSYKGLGVGLYIANQIVRAHHGTIKVESKHNVGSTFTVELPLKQPEKKES